jgi:phospholipid/cholesterol/gamma-HCH transport system permease protein
MADWVANIGRASVGWLAEFGDFWRFIGRMFTWIPAGLSRWRNLRLLTPQFYEIGTRSVPVILVTGTFVGLVMAVQAFDQLASVGLENRMGVLVNLSVVRELGPVLAGVMLAGRVGGALTAELGTMNVTEQIDALRAMGADPLRYLVVPRFLACLLLTPLLTFYCDVMGAIGGWIVTVLVFNVPSEPYWVYSAEAIARWDLFSGFLKSVFFGGAIGAIACYKGFTCRYGAEGVARACTEGFVIGFIVILILDFFLGLGLKSAYEAIWGFKSVL